VPVSLGLPLLVFLVSFVVATLGYYTAWCVFANQPLPPRVTPRPPYHWQPTARTAKLVTGRMSYLYKYSYRLAGAFKAPTGIISSQLGIVPPPPL
jgi:hypothetical protein